MESQNYNELNERTQELIEVFPKTDNPKNRGVSRFEMTTIDLTASSTYVFNFDNTAEYVAVCPAYAPTDDDGYIRISYGQTMNINQSLILRNGTYVKIQAKNLSICIESFSTVTIPVTLIVVNNFNFEMNVR